ncbi:MAG: hypothetical protein JXP72_05220 [Coriobacteriia bacterium]|nr:hypothetical protein [Coriobacteriia bacterium]
MLPAASSLLGHPLVAVTLGITLGVVLALVSERAVAFVTPDDPMRGLAIVGVMMGLRFTLALAALAAYFVFARDGLPAFGLALGLSFVAGLAFEAVRMSHPRASHTSA